MTSETQIKNKNRKTTNTQPTHHLPQTIISHIFSRYFRVAKKKPIFFCNFFFVLKMANLSIRCQREGILSSYRLKTSEVLEVMVEHDLMDLLRAKTDGDLDQVISLFFTLFSLILSNFF